MCTVTWVHDDCGYQLFCNRDEKLTRGVANPPGLSLRDGISFLAPQDADFGGTWISVNEFGVSVCLLNGAIAMDQGNSAGPSARRLKSRGLLLVGLAAAESIAAVSALVSKADLFAYAPFTLAVLERSNRSAVIEWNGFAKAISTADEPQLPLTSSSFDTDGVRSERRREYRRHVKLEKPDAGALLKFHRSHRMQPGAYSICMHRPDAETVSFSRITVTRAAAEFFYSPAAPCRQVPGQTTCLALRP